MTPETVALPVGPAAPPPPEPPACATALLPLPALAPPLLPPHPHTPAARTTAPSIIRLIVPPCGLNPSRPRRCRSALGVGHASPATSPNQRRARSSRSVRRTRASAWAHRDRPYTRYSPRRGSRLRRSIRRRRRTPSGLRGRP